MQQLIDAFSIERISKSGAKFDLEKAKWFNHQYLIHRDDAELAQLFQNVVAEKCVNADFERVKEVCPLVKERASFVNDLWDQAKFFFVAPESYDEQIIKKRWKEDTPTHLNRISEIIANTQPFSKDQAHDRVMEYIQQNGLNTGQIMNCLRLSLVGAAMGPDLFAIIGILGMEETQNRIRKAVDTIKI